MNEGQAMAVDMALEDTTADGPEPEGRRPRRKSGSTGPKLGGAQAIDRALSLLRLFGAGPAEFALSELSDALGLNPSTTHRIARALTRRGFLSQNSETGGYRLGGVLVLLGDAARRDFGMDRVVPVLSEIAAKFQDSVSLGVREGLAVGVLHRIESRRELRFSQRTGSVVPLHASAMGKAILCGAADLEAEIGALGDLPALTQNTVRDPAALAAQVKRSIERGYTIDNEEQVIGVRCVGVPIRDRRGTVRAALAIQAPAAHLDDRRVEEIGRQLPAYALRLAEAMRL
jgi:IclR family acetate operon transcriptional repressor